jgi:prepilin-type processing-associated H-X9-DG protein
LLAVLLARLVPLVEGDEVRHSRLVVRRAPLGPIPNLFAHIDQDTINDTARDDPEDFYTPHTGVAMFLFADGSVRTLRIGIDLKVLQALVTRNGGEVVNANEL